MARDVLAIRNKAFALVELTKTGVYAGTPGMSPGAYSELKGGESEIYCLLHGETFNTCWVKRPICWTPPTITGFAASLQP
jgi:hypothetical protein